MGRLKGKVAFITGSGAGIGRAAATMFSSEGARVAVVDMSRSAGEETVRLIRAVDGEAVYIETDVTDPQSVDRAVKTAVGEYGRINVLYNNAGGSTMADGAVIDVSIEEFWRAIRLDLFGMFLCCKYGIPELIRAGGGAVINMTSIVALVGVKGRDAYTAAKGGVLALTRSMAIEYAKDKVRVNAIAPGAIQTERVKNQLAQDARVEALIKRHPLGLGEPDDVARLALFLASDEARIITGAIYPIDSGYTAS
jgi:NAD(P)-dependent dehydrogenase (short-subunit alcohol dehydrogenase family)